MTPFKSFHKYFIKKLTSESPPNSGYLCHIFAFMGVSSQRAAAKNGLLQEKEVPRFIITAVQVQLRPQASVTIHVQNHPQRKANLKNVLRGVLLYLWSISLEAGWYSTHGKAGLHLLLGSPNCLGSNPEQPATRRREKSNLGAKEKRRAHMHALK